MGYRCKICEVRIYNDRASESDLKHDPECLEAARTHVENLVYDSTLKQKEQT